MSRYKLTPLAAHNLKDLWKYTVKTWGRVQAESYRTKIEDQINLISRFPGMGIIREEIDSELRSFPAEHHILYYFIGKNRIEIIAILHKHMDPVLHLPQ